MRHHTTHDTPVTQPRAWRGIQHGRASRHTASTIPQDNQRLSGILFSFTFNSSPQPSTSNLWRYRLSRLHATRLAARPHVALSRPPLTRASLRVAEHAGDHPRLPRRGPRRPTLSSRAGMDGMGGVRRCSAQSMGSLRSSAEFICRSALLIKYGSSTLRSSWMAICVESSLA